MNAAVDMVSRMRSTDKLVKGTSSPSPSRQPATVRAWLDSLALTEYSHLFAAYRSMQVNRVALVEKFTTQLFYAQSIPNPIPNPNPNPIPNLNPITNPIPNPALVELTRRLTEID